MATLYLVGISLPNGEEEKIPVKRMGEPFKQNTFEDGSIEDMFLEAEYDKEHDLVHALCYDGSVEHYSIGE